MKLDEIERGLILRIEKATREGDNDAGRELSFVLTRYRRDFQLLPQVEREAKG